MNDKWLNFAMRIQSIAQAGLQYGKDRFDRERYQELRQIAAEMLSERADIPIDMVQEVFCNETGYQKPKVDTRDELPDNLAVQKCTREQILMCFTAYENPSMPTQFE